ncbi:MAG: RlmE family RNA methyltransferase [Burkholderiales bacterium]|nr:RlmE family RNA methyltransferase [Burkholderiales bacterium]
MKRKSSKVNRAWLHEHLSDPYVRRAQQEGYRSRAAYKLQEIDESLALIRPGQVVVDLGSAPGAWSQYLRRRLAPQGAAAGALPGAIVATDLLEMEPVEGVQFLQGDFRDDAVLARLEALLAGRPVDLVVSDMAPNLSGVAASDAARVAHLVELALEFACRHLRPDGALVVKCFHGSGYSQLVERFKRSFRSVKAVKPRASRARSAETFLVGRGPKAGREGGAGCGQTGLDAGN